MAMLITHFISSWITSSSSSSCSCSGIDLSMLTFELLGPAATSISPPSSMDDDAVEFKCLRSITSNACSCSSTFRWVIIRTNILMSFAAQIYLFKINFFYFQNNCLQIKRIETCWKSPWWNDNPDALCLPAKQATSNCSGVICISSIKLPSIKSTKCLYSS